MKLNSSPCFPQAQTKMSRFTNVWPFSKSTCTRPIWTNNLNLLSFDRCAVTVEIWYNRSLSCRRTTRTVLAGLMMRRIYGGIFCIIWCKNKNTMCEIFFVFEKRKTRKFSRNYFLDSHCYSQEPRVRSFWNLVWSFYWINVRNWFFAGKKKLPFFLRPKSSIFHN